MNESMEMILRETRISEREIAIHKQDHNIIRIDQLW